MATGRIPGPIGAPGRPCEGVHDGTNGLFTSSTPGSLGLCHTNSDFGALCKQITQGASWVNTQQYAVRLLGSHSFGLGVAYGIGEELVSSVIELFDLAEMFVLADLYDVANSESPLWMQIVRDGALWPTKRLLSSIAHRHLEAELRQAKEERDLLIAGIRHLITHPVDALIALKDEYVRKWREFEIFRAQQSLISQFHAGVIFGGLLLEIMSAIASGVGLARAIAVAVPRIAKIVVLFDRTGHAVHARNPQSMSSSKTKPLLAETRPKAALQIEYGKTGPSAPNPEERIGARTKTNWRHEDAKAHGVVREPVQLPTTPMNERYLGEEIHGNTRSWVGARGAGPVTYYSDAERAKLRLTIRDGKFYGANGKLFDTRTEGTVHNLDRAIFVMDEHGNVFASCEPDVFRVHHSSLAQGKPVAMAGELEVQNGSLKYISNNSGHYTPSEEFFQRGMNHMREQGIDFSYVIDDHVK